MNKILMIRLLSQTTSRVLVILNRIISIASANSQMIKGVSLKTTYSSDNKITSIDIDFTYSKIEDIEVWIDRY